MSNMSYCRFENTLEDLQDCYDALIDIDSLDGLSKSEAKAARDLIVMCRDIFMDCSHLIENPDN